MKQNISKKVISIAVASIIATGSTQGMASQASENVPHTKKQSAAISIGAVSGALIAGPAGFVIGGLVGSVFGRSDQKSEGKSVDALADTESMLSEMLVTAKQQNQPEMLLVASTSNAIPMSASKTTEAINGLKDIISNDLSMDVYFKAGSVSLEGFYSKQLSVISSLLNEIPDLQLSLDGYSDRQGDQADNLQLSVARLESVRKYFVKNGIDNNRINIRAHGEKNFVSTAGELAAYVFDRRVVLSFETFTPTTNNNVAVVSETSSL